MDANLGGTVILAPLHRILTEKTIPGYPRHVFLLTDGSVSDVDKIKQMISKNNKYSRVYTIGIGNGSSN